MTGRERMKGRISSRTHCKMKKKKKLWNKHWYKHAKRSQSLFVTLTNTADFYAFRRICVWIKENDVIEFVTMTTAFRSDRLKITAQTRCTMSFDFLIADPDSWNRKYSIVNTMVYMVINIPGWPCLSIQINNLIQQRCFGVKYFKR